MDVEKNAFIRLATRAASEAWTLKRVNLELSTMARGVVPTATEMDEARHILGTRMLSFDVAAAVDMLFDADVPGIPDDPDHNIGNVHYYLAAAWLDRAEEGERRGHRFFWRHCSIAREFYSTWPPLVPGAGGHPTWADVLQLEAQMLWNTGSEAAKLGNLRNAIDLFEQARPCYPEDSRAWPVFAAQSSALLELANHEDANRHLRKALHLCRAGLALVSAGTEGESALLTVEAEVWQELSAKRLIQPDDGATLDQFVHVVLTSAPPMSPLYEKVISIKSKVQSGEVYNNGERPFSRRLRALFNKLIYD